MGIHCLLDWRRGKAKYNKRVRLTTTMASVRLLLALMVLAAVLPFAECNIIQDIIDVIVDTIITFVGGLVCVQIRLARDVLLCTLFPQNGLCPDILNIYSFFKCDNVPNPPP